MLIPNAPRTINQLHAEMLDADPNCALTMSALRRLVRSGKIRSCRVGSKYLITYDAVADYINGRTTAETKSKAVPGIRTIDL